MKHTGWQKNRLIRVPFGSDGTYVVLSKAQKDLAPRDTIPVRMRIEQFETHTGEDLGVIYFDGPLLVFEGNKTHFALQSRDLRDEPSLDRLSDRHEIDLSISGDTHMVVRLALLKSPLWPKRDELANQLSSQLDSWRSQQAETESVLPPRSVDTVAANSRSNTAAGLLFMLILGPLACLSAISPKIHHPEPLYFLASVVFVLMLIPLTVLAVQANRESRVAGLIHQAARSKSAAR